MATLARIASALAAHAHAPVCVCGLSSQLHLACASGFDLIFIATLIDKFMQCHPLSIWRSTWHTVGTWPTWGMWHVACGMGHVARCTGVTPSWESALAAVAAALSLFIDSVLHVACGSCID